MKRELQAAFTRLFFSYKESTVELLAHQESVYCLSLSEGGRHAKILAQGVLGSGGLGVKVGGFTDKTAI